MESLILDVIRSIDVLTLDFKKLREKFSLLNNPGKKFSEDFLKLAREKGIPIAAFLNNLDQLTTLDLSNSNISDISFLKNFIHLLVLDFSNNNISNISPLINLTQLEKLSLQNNQIQDISSLENLTKLHTLTLNNNKLRKYRMQLKSIIVEKLQ